MILIHGLGGNKTSFFETVSALTPHYTVHAIDLPGFGSSSKPIRAPYDAAWFARVGARFMDALGIERAHLVGNSLGGRVAIEVGLTAPDRVASLSLLAPSMAWRRRRGFVPIVKLLRPELAAIPHTIGRGLVRRQFWSMFARPERLHPSAADVAVRGVPARPTARWRPGSPSTPPRGTSTWRSRTARERLLDPARGSRARRRCSSGATRTRSSRSPSASHVGEALPEARQVVLEECGHVPQVELPEQANGLVHDFIARGLRLAPRRAPPPGSRRRGAAPASLLAHA